MTDKQYLNVVRGFGIYHAVAIAPLALPIVSDLVWELFGALHASLQLTSAWPTASPSQMLFVNLFGAAAFLWALVRIRQPSRQLGHVEGWGMLVFSTIVIYHVIGGASPLWLIIPLVDLPGGLIHLYFNKV